MNTPDLPLDLAELEAVHRRLGGEVIETPLWANDFMSREFGAPIFFKLENLQRTGSFKLRGASNKINRLLAGGKEIRGVVAASAGNHAQGLARAAMAAGLPATVVMPVSAPLTKIESCRTLGAEVILSGATLEDAKQVADRLATECRFEFVHPYDDWDVIAGQGGVGLEIIAALPDVGTVIVPLGGGGLISGIALAIKLQRPATRIIGVQTAAVAPFRNFLRDGTLEAVSPTAHTIADGIKVKSPGLLTRQVIARYVDEIVVVDDNAIAEAMVSMLERTRTIGEGAGVVGLAALMKGLAVPRAGESIVVIVSGGNADMSLVGRSIDYGLASSGRLMSLVVTMPDSPGHLAALLGTIAEHGINVQHVEHRRGELHVPVGMTEVIMQIETRNFAHQQELLEHFARQGLAARSLLGAGGG